MREPREPAEALDLVAAQRRLQRGGHRGLERGGLADPRDAGLPGVVAFDRRFRRELLHRERGQRIHPHAAVGRLRERGELLEALAQLRGERNESRLAERHVAPARRACPLDDRLHLQHLPLVERETARHLQPVATRSEGDLQVAGRVGPRHGEPLALRPGDADRVAELLQCLDKRKGVLGLLDAPLERVVAAPEHRGRVEHPPRALPLRLEVAHHRAPLAADLREHANPALARCVARTLGAERPHAEPEAQTTPRGAELRVDRRIAGRLRGGGARSGVHLEETRRRLHRTRELIAACRRHVQAAADELGDPAVRDGEPDHPRPRGRLAHEQGPVVAGGRGPLPRGFRRTGERLAQIGVHGDDDAILRRPHLQPRHAGRELDRRGEVALEEHARMADERRERAVGVELVERGAQALHGARDRRIVGRDPLALREARERHGLALGPAARAAALLLRLDPDDPVAVFAEDPHDARRRLVLALGVGEAGDDGERAPPLRLAGERASERPGEPRWQRFAAGDCERGLELLRHALVAGAAIGRGPLARDLGGAAIELRPLPGGTLDQHEVGQPVAAREPAGIAAGAIAQPRFGERRHRFPDPGVAGASLGARIALRLFERGGRVGQDERHRPQPRGAERQQPAPALVGRAQCADRLRIELARGSGVAGEHGRHPAQGEPEAVGRALQERKRLCAAPLPEPVLGEPVPEGRRRLADRDQAGRPLDNLRRECGRRAHLQPEQRVERCVAPGRLHQPGKLRAERIGEGCAVNRCGIRRSAGDRGENALRLLRIVQRTQREPCRGDGVAGGAEIDLAGVAGTSEPERSPQVRQPLRQAPGRGGVHERAREVRALAPVARIPMAHHALACERRERRSERLPGVGAPARLADAAVARELEEARPAEDPRGREQLHQGRAGARGRSGFALARRRGGCAGKQVVGRESHRRRCLRNDSGGSCASLRMRGAGPCCASAVLAGTCHSCAATGGRSDPR